MVRIAMLAMFARFIASISNGRCNIPLQAWVCNSPLVGDTTYDGADDVAMRLRGRGLFLCANEIELEHPYYNTHSGRQEWNAERRGSDSDDASVWENEDTGIVMVRARISLPAKFESLLKHESSRAARLAGAVS